MLIGIPGFYQQGSKYQRELGIGAAKAILKIIIIQIMNHPIVALANMLQVSHLLGFVKFAQRHRQIRLSLMPASAQPLIELDRLICIFTLKASPRRLYATVLHNRLLVDLSSKHHACQLRVKRHARLPAAPRQNFGKNV